MSTLRRPRVPDAPGLTPSIAAISLELAHEDRQALGDLGANVDGTFERGPVLNQLVQAVLALAEAEEQRLGRLDGAVLDRAHHVEGRLRGEHEHRGDVVDDLLIEARRIDADAGPVDAELQGRGDLGSLPPQQLRVALKAAEDLGEVQAARLELAQRRPRL